MPKKIKEITLEDVYSLGLQTNNELKQSTSALTKQIRLNSDGINANTQAIAANAKGIISNSKAIASNSAAIASNSKEIAATKKQVETNTTIIKQVLVKVAENSEKIDKHENTISKLLSSQFRMERDLQEIKDTIKCIPQLYNNVDAFAKEVLGYRHEQTFVNKRLDEHENRLEVLEQTQLPFVIA